MTYRIRKLVVGLFAIAPVCILQAATYYVDPATGSMSNPGTSAAPWSTLEAVFVAGKTFASGDVINLRDGFHGSPVVTGIFASGNVTIQPQSGHAPKLRKLTFNSARRWVVTDLDISPRNANVYDNSDIVTINSNSSFITLQNCYIYHATSIAGWAASDFGGRMGLAVVCRGPDCIISNNHIRKSRNCIIIHYTAPRAEVRYNLIEDIMEDGIRCLSDDSVYEYNTIRNFYGVNTAHDDGFQSWTTGPGGNGTGTLYNNVLRGNVIINITDPSNPFPGTNATYASHGIGLFNGMFEDWVLENNVVMIDKGHGIALGGAKNSRVVNNTVVKNPYDINGQSPWITIYNDPDGNVSSGNVLRNNLSSVVPPSSFTITGTTQSNNIVTTSYTSYFDDYANRDLHLKSGSPAIGAGTTTNAPTIDIDGVTRSVPYDVGAYEYSAATVLAGHWKFDETTGTTAADSSGNGNSGTLQNGPSWAAAQLNNGLSFDGADDVVNCGSGSTLDNLPRLTVAAWINAASLGEGSKGRIAVKGTGIGPSAGWHFHVTGTNQLSFLVDHATTDLQRIAAANAISLNTWRHVAVTWTGSTTATDIKLYVDGAEVSYATTTNGAGTRTDDASSTLYIGNNSTLDRTFDGVLDDVRIYNGVLDSAAILALYQQGPPSAPSSLTATTIAYDQIDLAWTDNAANETGYKIERKKGSAGTYAQIQTVAANVTSYSDSTAGAGTTYYYRVRAYNSDGDSAYSADANATSQEVTSGRQAHWKLDEGSGTTTADASGNGNTGSLGASPANPAWTSSGRIGSALDFDGGADVVTAGSGSSLDNLSAITVAGWIHADSLGGGSKGRIAVKGNGTGPSAGWHFHVTLSNQLSFVVDYSTTNLQQLSAASAITLGAWYHVAITWTGSATASNVKIYVDGSEVGYATTTNGSGSRVDDSASTVYLGNESGGTRGFDGLLDDVRIYDRVLTTDELTAIYRAGL